jgi:competence protein ComEA
VTKINSTRSTLPVITHITQAGPPGGATSQAASKSSSKTRANSPAGTPVNLNTATAAELEQLPHVGPVLAARIVAYRDANGKFANVEGLTGVKGVGPAMLERLRPYVRAP